MKAIKRRVAALGLALLLAASPAAMASEAMGNEIHGGQTVLSHGANLKKQIFWSDTYSDLRTEYYVTYAPNTDVVPTVAYGNKVLTRATLTSMAQSLEAQGKRVVSGINGDFYVMATGAPLGMVITDGVLRSSASYHWAVGFQEDGAAFIGKPNLAITATFGGNTVYIGGGVNKIRRIRDPKTNIGGLTLLTEDFSGSTQNSDAGVDVILTPVSDNVGQAVNVDLDIQSGSTNPASPPADPVSEEGATDSTDLDGVPAPDENQPTPTSEVKGVQIQSKQLNVGGRVTCTVDQVLESTGSIAIPSGKMVLTLNGKDDAALLAQLRALKPGDTVNLDITSPDARWSQATQAIGAMYKLVTNGAVAPEATNTSAAKERTARTAIGIRADGSTVFYTMDGKRPGYSIGASMGQVAMRLIELGCVEAVGLDGGGSTNLGVTYPDGSTMQVQGKPADGSQRPNSTAIFLTTTMKPTNIPGSTLYVTPDSSLMLAGASVQLSTAVLDTSFYSMGPASDVLYSIYNGDGIISADGIFTAGSESGISQVTAATADGTATGTASMTVIKRPDKITVTNQANGAAVTGLSLSPGQQVDLTASAVYKSLAVTSQDVCYTWTLDPALGTVDANGLVTAGTESASGNLVVSAGGNTVTIPVSIAGHVLPLESFESGTASFTGTDTATAAAETDLEHVRYGKQSMRVEYSVNPNGTASLSANLAVTPGESYLGLWVYGDNSGNRLSATVADAAGLITEIPVTTLDFTGWKQIIAPLGSGTASLRGIQVLADGTVKTGTIWLDQLTTSNEQASDTTPPTVTVKLSGNQLTAAVSDNLDRSFSADRVQVTYDGAVVASTWDSGTNTLKATLPAADGKPHRATVTAQDASGNLGRGSVDIPATGTNMGVFADMDDHWAASYANYLYYTGVTNGVGEPDSLQFLPNKKITRGEFFAMVARWMKLDLTHFSEVKLPFVDTDAIPDWALAEIKAMYGLGILKGSDNNGVIRVNATSNISRAEAMTILGRTQARGYPESAITFADAGSVPDWSLPYVRSLVGQGVVSGFENKMNPNDPVTRGEVAKMLYTML